MLWVRPLKKKKKRQKIEKQKIKIDVWILPWRDSDVIGLQDGQGMELLKALYFVLRWTQGIGPPIDIYTWSKFKKCVLVGN